MSEVIHEPGPTLQEEADAQAQASTPAPEAPPVPEKFQNEDGSVNTDALLNSYKELESKLGQSDSSANTETNVEPIESRKDATIEANKPEDTKSLDPFFAEWEESGNLSEKSFESLEKDFSIPRHVAEQFMAAQVRNAELETKALIESVGGDAKYKQMIEWAAQNWKAEDIQNYDNAVGGIDNEARASAFKNLSESYKTANGITEQVESVADTRAQIDPPFESQAQMLEAMRDPKWKTDPAYRASVYRRVGAGMGMDPARVAQVFKGPLA